MQNLMNAATAVDLPQLELFTEGTLNRKKCWPMFFRKAARRRWIC